MSSQVTKHRSTRKQSKRKLSERTIPRLETFKNVGAGLAATGVRVGFPANRTVVLNYCEKIQLTTALAGVPTQYRFRLNSAFDPNQTGTGHQPMGFDQWSQFYNHYAVLETEYQVQMVGPNETCMFGTYLSDDSTTPTSVNDLGELGATIHYWNPTNQAYTSSGKVIMAQFFNRKDVPTDSDLRSVTSANPAEVAFLNVFYQTDVTATTMNFYLKFSMKVQFMEPIDLGPSASAASKLGSKTTLKLPPQVSDLSSDYEYVRVKKISLKD